MPLYYKEFDIPTLWGWCISRNSLLSQGPSINDVQIQEGERGSWNSDIGGGRGSKSPKKFGHHLWTFPHIVRWTEKKNWQSYIVRCTEESIIISHCAVDWKKMAILHYEEFLFYVLNSYIMRIFGSTLWGIDLRSVSPNLCG